MLQKQDPIGVDDDVMALGAGSLQVYSLVGQLHRLGYRAVEPLDVYRCPTIRQLAAHLARSASSSTTRVSTTPTTSDSSYGGGVQVAHKWASPNTTAYCLEIALSRALATLLRAEAVALDDDLVEILARRFHPLSQLGFLDRVLQEAYKQPGVRVEAVALRKHDIYVHRSPHSIAAACGNSTLVPEAADSLQELPTGDLEESVLSAVRQIVAREDIGHHTDLSMSGWTDSMTDKLYKVLHNTHSDLPFPLPNLAPATTSYQVAFTLRAVRSSSALSRPPVASILPLYVPASANETTPRLILAHPALRTSLSYKALSRMFNDKFSVYGIEESGEFQYYDSIKDMAQMYLSILIFVSASKMVVTHSRYTRAIEASQPATTPFILAGWSFGAALAYEVAQELAQGGRRAQCLCVLDGAVPSQGDGGDPIKGRVSDLMIVASYLDTMMMPGGSDGKKKGTITPPVLVPLVIQSAKSGIAFAV